MIMLLKTLSSQLHSHVSYNANILDSAIMKCAKIGFNQYDIKIHNSM